MANSGVGEPWPQVQVDAYFAATLEMNRRFGNAPGDVFTHALGAGDGWTDRKIDPATADAVQGGWRPRSVTSSGTWSLADIRAECARRAGTGPPEPPPEGDDDMTAEEHDWLKRVYTALFVDGGEMAGYPSVWTMIVRTNGACFPAGLTDEDGNLLANVGELVQRIAADAGLPTT